MWLALSLLLALALTAATQTPSPSTCTNDDLCVLSCVGCENEEMVHDPYDCHNYYMCLNQQPVPDLLLTCPDGQHFNAMAHECQAGDECLGCTGASCRYQCEENLHIYPVHSFQFDCSTYVLCNSDGYEIGSLTCPEETPYFNGTSCQTDESQCCSCRPYCTLAMIGHDVFDPIDCTKFYFCIDEGIPDIFSKCPDGENFDSMTEQCSEFAPCSTPPGCINVVSPSGCIEVFTCNETLGDFPKCQTQCVEEYFYCSPSDIGHRVDPQTCPDGLVFNPVDHQCIPEGDCPFTYSVRLLSLNNTVLAKNTRR